MIMRTALLLAPYKSFAARGRLSMAFLAVMLLFAIMALLAVSAGSAHASFLTAEARNVISMRSDADPGLIVTAIVMFGVSFATIIGLSRISTRK
ncbi:hypothetical protein BH10PSE7_BH10PSE7_21830 [soil metagenome]